MHTEAITRGNFPSEVMLLCVLKSPFIAPYEPQLTYHSNVSSTGSPLLVLGTGAGSIFTGPLPMPLRR